MKVQSCSACIISNVITKPILTWTYDLEYNPVTMTRIDRYILFLFIRVWIIVFLCLVGLLVIIHLFTNFDEFVEYGKTQGSLIKVLFEYYGPYSLALLDRFGGMLALLAIMFVVSWLKRTNELTAMMAAGVSPRRILAYPLIASVFLFLATAAVRELVIPRYEDTLGKNPQDLAVNHLRQVRPTYDANIGVLFSGRNLSVAVKQIYDPIFRLEGPAAVLGPQLVATQAVHVPGDTQHPAGFVLSEVTTPSGIDQIDSVLIGGKPTIVTSKNTPWLSKGQCFVATEVEFGVLRGGGGWKQYASTLDMITRMRSSANHFGDDLKVTVHTRFVQPLLDMTLLMMGIPIVLKRQDRHLFYIAGVTFMTVGMFMCATLVIQSFAASGAFLPPFLGAWLPLILFTPFAWARTRVSLES